MLFSGEVPSAARRLVLVDGSNFLYRSFYAMPPLQTMKGEPTGAVKGMMNAIKQLLREYAGSPMVVMFDASGGSFRNDIYPEYKNNRKRMPDDLKPQVKTLRRLLQALGLPLVELKGLEADDVIGTYALQAQALGMDVVIASGDKDIAQLVNANVSVLTSVGGNGSRVLDEEGVQEQYGVPPHLLVDYLALVGDQSDNIPGVKGVGDKGAIALLERFAGGLSEIYENIDEVRQREGNIQGKLKITELKIKTGNI